mmetsp:Transcript_132667/g.248122  ORF Transcript_132667/g.248122 Transcript_132667/m.248122 type:complete len:235 (+) Transcript_132667:2309-3013(+)
MLRPCSFFFILAARPALRKSPLFSLATPEPFVSPSAPSAPSAASSSSSESLPMPQAFMRSSMLTSGSACSSPSWSEFTSSSVGICPVFILWNALLIERRGFEGMAAIASGRAESMAVRLSVSMKAIARPRSFVSIAKAFSAASMGSSALSISAFSFAFLSSSVSCIIWACISSLNPIAFLPLAASITLFILISFLFPVMLSLPFASLNFFLTLPLRLLPAALFISSSSTGSSSS